MNSWADPEPGAAATSPAAAPTWRQQHPRNRSELEAFLWRNLPRSVTYEQVTAILDAADWYASHQAEPILRRVAGLGKKKGT